LFPQASVAESLSLEFRVLPESQPPTNVHVIIGRNGVGKTTLLNNMTKSLLIDPPDPMLFGEFTDAKGLLKQPKMFANLVSVSSGAFDFLEAIPDKRGGEGGINYSYVGLKTISGPDAKNSGPKSPEMLDKEFVRSVSNCLNGAKQERWRTALRTLESDPIF